MKTSNEYFNNIKAAAGRGNAYHIGMITKRRYEAIRNKVEREWINAKTDFKFGVLTKDQFDTEMEKINLMAKSLSTAEII